MSYLHAVNITCGDDGDSYEVSAWKDGYRYYATNPNASGKWNNGVFEVDVSGWFHFDEYERWFRMGYNAAKAGLPFRITRDERIHPMVDCVERGKAFRRSVIGTAPGPWREGYVFPEEPKKTTTKIEPWHVGLAIVGVSTVATGLYFLLRRR